MSIPLAQRFHSWFGKNLTLPDDSEEVTRQKKTFFNANIGVVLVVGTLTCTTWLLGLPVLCSYGFGLVAFNVTLIAIFLKTKRLSPYFYIFNQAFVLLFTSFTIIRLGGIPSSGGLIFAKLAAIVYSLSLPSKKLAWWSFLLFVATTILEAALYPWLTPAPEMTPVINQAFFVINATWISLFMLLIVFYVFKQRADLEQAKAERLQEVDDLKTRMFANIAHEFRTPLTLIGGMTELLREDPQHQLRERTETIQRNANKVLRLVNQMLNLARLKDGSMPLQLVQADIAAFLFYVFNSYQGLAEHRKVKLHFLSDHQPMVLDFDPEKMEELVGNLLSNALKYTPAGGDVYFDFYCTKSSAEQLVIKVKDTGIGIPANQLVYIFDRFYRVENEQKNFEEGSGIGLNMVREYARLMGGDVSVESKPNKGSGFTVTLPVTRLAPLQMSTPVETVSPEPLDLGWMPTENSDPTLPQLLIIEDNPEVIQYLRQVLGKNFRLLAATNGNEGIRQALEQVPDLVLCDVMMPGKDGFEVCRTLKKDFRTCHIPVVFLTARADTSSRIIGLEQGADAYLTKPFNKRELLACLRNLFIQREKVRLKFSSHINGHEPETTDGLDAVFLKNVRAILEKNYADEAFGIEELYRALNISRVQLHRKLMALTGQSASHFIRSFRLEKAKGLLRQTTKSVSEIAYETGFSDANYFSRVFAHEFGMAASDLRKGTVKLP